MVGLAVISATSVHERILHSAACMVIHGNPWGRCKPGQARWHAEQSRRPRQQQQQHCQCQAPGQAARRRTNGRSITRTLQNKSEYYGVLSIQSRRPRQEGVNSPRSSHIWQQGKDAISTTRFKTCPSGSINSIAYWAAVAIADEVHQLIARLPLYMGINHHFCYF
jgi:hypothetical protein